MWATPNILGRATDVFCAKTKLENSRETKKIPEKAFMAALIVRPRDCRRQGRSSWAFYLMSDNRYYVKYTNGPPRLAVSPMSKDDSRTCCLNQGTLKMSLVLNPVRQVRRNERSRGEVSFATDRSCCFWSCPPSAQ